MNTNTSVSQEIARRRVADFAEKFRDYDGMLHLAYHAALPVALNVELLHLLRINFFLDIAQSLPDTAEADLLLSPLCNEIGEGLYEIEPGVRSVLLQTLNAEYGRKRIDEVATLLWQYARRDPVWAEHPALERAQQLTALIFLNFGKATQWLEEAEEYAGQIVSEEREWFIAMRREATQIEKVLNFQISTQIEYLNFEVLIDAKMEKGYPVFVMSSVGQVQGIMHFPYDQFALERFFDKLQIALLRSGQRFRMALSSSDLDAVQQFGGLLFNSLFTGSVHNCYVMTKHEAEQKGIDIRLKMRIQPPELAALPWEYLYDTTQREFVCILPKILMSRYLELPRYVRSLSIQPPLRILGMIATPRDLPALDVEIERSLMEEVTGKLQERGLVELTWLSGQTVADLQEGLWHGPWHIFYFIGHGGFDHSVGEGAIMLENERGDSHRLHATQLAQLLTEHKSLRLVVLNSCEGARGSDRDIFSSTAAVLVQRGIPAVVAIQFPISDAAAAAFTRCIYPLLAQGTPIDAAMAKARKAMRLTVPNTLEWSIPVLYMRAPDAVLFNVQDHLYRDGELMKSQEQSRVPKGESNELEQPVLGASAERGEQVRKLLQERAREWDTGGRHPDYLYRGVQLDTILKWLEIYNGELNKLEQAFLDASVESERRTDNVFARISNAFSRFTSRILAVLGNQQEAQNLKHLTQTVTFGEMWKAEHPKVVLVLTGIRPGHPAEWDDPATYSTLQSMVRTGTEYRLFRAQTRIGRSRQDADIVITEDGAMSRLQAIITEQEDGFHITNQSGNNPTLVNDQEISMETGERGVLLHDGDEITLGGLIFTFQLLENNGMF